MLCCGSGWCLQRLFLKNIYKNWLFCCCGDDRDDRSRASCYAATHLAGPSPPPPPPPPPPLLLLLLRLRLLCCGSGWCLLRLFLKNITKNWLFCCCGDDLGDRSRPSCCAATLLAEPSPAPPPPPPPPPPLLLLLLLRLRLRCFYCAAAAAAAAGLLLCCCLSDDGVVLGLPLLVSLGATAPCLNSKFDIASPLPTYDLEAVYAFSAIRSLQTQPKACRSESGFFLAGWKNFL